MSEIHDVVEVRPAGDHRLWIRFDNGAEGVVDLSGLRFRGVFESLRDPDEFAKATVNPELGTVCWATGADLDPVVLYSHITGEPIVVNGVVVETPPYAGGRRSRKPGRLKGAVRMSRDFDAPMPEDLGSSD